MTRGCLGIVAGAVLLAGAGLPENAWAQESVAIRAMLVKTVPDDPAAAAWSSAIPAKFPLSPQVHWPTRILVVTAKDVTARGLSDGKQVAIMLEYEDPTEDPDDAAAVEFMVGYVHCSLDDAHAEELVGSLFVPSTPLEPTDLGSVLKLALKAEGIADARATQLVDARAASRHALGFAVRQTAENGLGVVRTALAQASIAPRPVFDRAALLAEARSHVWVQVEVDDGWRDLDPSFPRAQPGEAFCPAAEVWTDPPADLYQTVTFRVRNESVENGAAAFSSGLEQRVTTAELHGQPILLINFGAPTDSTQGAVPGVGSRFVPVLIVGDQFLGGEEFQPLPVSGEGRDVLGGNVLDRGKVGSMNLRATVSAAFSVCPWCTLAVSQGVASSQLFLVNLDVTSPCFRRGVHGKSEDIFCAHVPSVEAHGAVTSPAIEVHPFNSQVFTGPLPEPIKDIIAKGPSDFQVAVLGMIVPKQWEFSLKMSRQPFQELDVVWEKRDDFWLLDLPCGLVVFDDEQSGVEINAFRG